MALFSFFKRRPKTNFASFRNYNRSLRIARRKPIDTKRSILPDAISTRRSKKFEILKNKGLNYLKIAAFLGLAITAIYLIFFTETFKIQKIDIKGDMQTAEEQEIVNAYLQKYLNDNIIFFNSSEHEKNLIKDLAYLKTLSIYRLLPNTVVAKIETYPLAANIKIFQPNGTGQHYVVNELGYIASIGAKDDNLPTITMDVTGTEMEINEGGQAEMPRVNTPVIDNEALAIILDAKKDFEAKFNLQILETSYLRRAKELHFFTELRFSIWIDMTQDIDIQLAKMKKALTKLNIYETPIDYIDLRISGQNGEKVIYRLKE